MGRGTPHHDLDDEADAMRILHVIPSLAPRYGGPSAVTPEMCMALGDRGHTVEIVTTDRDGPGRMPVPTGRPVVWRRVTTTFYRQHTPRLYASSFGLGTALRRRVPDFDVVHIHGLYLFPTFAAGHYCRRFDVPYIIRPHGTLDSYQRSKHRSRKAIYATLTERRNLDAAMGLHYTSAAERDQAASLGLHAPAFVVPLGVDIAALDRPVDAERLLQRWPQLAGQRLVTFLGRLAHKKRLDLLIDAFAKLASTFSQIHLAIAGPDDVRLGPSLRGRIKALGLQSRASFLGLLTGDLKTALLQRSHVFVLPSEDENFAVSMVEAMAVGSPVVVTPGVALHGHVTAANAGIVVPPAVDPLAEALHRLVGDERLASSMGANARKLATSTFSWSHVAGELERIYDEAIRRRRS
jgi:glycosyltransferase involved in cell wall biosynthesis